MKKYLMEDPTRHNEKLAEALESSGMGFIKNLEILDFLIIRLELSNEEASFVLTEGREIGLEEIKKMRKDKIDPRKSV